MSQFKVHTNIALDYPAHRSGNIYTTENIKAIFERPEFLSRIANNALYGTFGCPVELYNNFPKEMISHVVRKAYISDDMEIQFLIETLNNEAGKSLAKILEKSEFNAIAKMVARMSKTVVNGKFKVHDIVHVHMVKYEPINSKKDQGS